LETSRTDGTEMTGEKLTTICSLLGELADELTNSEFTDAKNQVVDCILVVIDHLGIKEGSND
jgi:hypothetical protein